MRTQKARSNAINGVLAVTLLVAVASSLAPDPAQADPYRWCANYGRGNGGTNCGFVTLQQCRAAISGNGGFCTRNPYYSGWGRRPG